LRLKSGQGARIAWRPVVAEVPFAAKDKRVEAEKTWTERGFKVRTFAVGSVFGMAGKVYDNRTYVITVVSDKDEDREHSVQLSSDLLKKYGVRISLYPDVMERPAGELEIVDEAGNVLETAKDVVSVTPAPDRNILVRKIEHGKGYSWHGFEDRRYKGEVIFTLDRSGKIVVINSLPFTDLLKGLVPSEIFSNAHPQALRAQAVAARSEILAKIGHRHPGNPYLLCSEQHCQVYSGLARDVPATTAAVLDTEGEVLVSGSRIVGAVYSSNCGGHTEDNDVAWDQEPDPALRGKPDAPEGSELARKWNGLSDPGKLGDWLQMKPRTWCDMSSYGRSESFRWTRVVRSADMDTLVNKKYKVGRVKDVKIMGRGASGRVTGVKIIGEKATAYVGREFNVRQIFGGLKSGMFELSIARSKNGLPAKFSFKGGGWGHGVGMCQTGAIGMAESGKSYKDILRHYFSGAEILKVY
jgi:SpoIID/LytB domain protein